MYTEQLRIIYKIFIFIFLRKFGLGWCGVAIATPNLTQIRPCYQHQLVTNITHINLHPSSPFISKTKPTLHVIQEIPIYRIIGLSKVHFDNHSFLIWTSSKVNHFITTTTPSAKDISLRNADWFLATIESITFPSLLNKTLAKSL
jgi:hypothetical protein